MKGHNMCPIRHLAQLFLATLGYLLDKAGLGTTPDKALSYLKWQKKVVFTSGKTTVEKVSIPEVETSEIMEKLKTVNFL